jgi:hypothetical protein
MLKFCARIKLFKFKLILSSTYLVKEAQTNE